MLIHATIRAAVTRLSPSSAPLEASMLRLADDARKSATTAGMSGHTTNEQMANTSAAMALPSVLRGTA